MKFKPVEYITKSGKNIIIREVRTSDSKKIINCVKSYLKSGFIPLTPDEFNPTLNEQIQWINEHINGKNDLLLIAEYNSEIIGNIDLTINHRQMLKHTGYIGMGVHEDWQNQGIGTALMEKIINWSDNNPEIEILWLQVFGNNEAGINLYKKFGFIEEGRQTSFIKSPEGEYIDNLIMTRKTINR